MLNIVFFTVTKHLKATKLLFINFLQLCSTHENLFITLFQFQPTITLHVVNDSNLLAFDYLCKSFD